MLYKVILFDLDDTLIDFTASEAINLHKLYKQFYQSVDVLTFDSFYRKINKNTRK